MRARGLLLIPALTFLLGASSRAHVLEAASWLTAAAADLAENGGARVPLMPAPSPAPRVAPAAAAPPPSPAPPEPSVEAEAEAQIETQNTQAIAEREASIEEADPNNADPSVTEAPVAEPEPAPEAPSDPSLIEREPTPRARPIFELASTARETWVFAEPRWGSRRLGYLRAGAIVERRSKPSGFSSCTEGWYSIAPRGFVCVGSAATLSTDDPVAAISARRPDMSSLPYTYALSRAPTPPLYARLPTTEEQRREEPDLKNHLASSRARAALDPAYVAPPAPDPTPESLVRGGATPALANMGRAAGSLVLGRAKPRSGFALLSTFDHEGRRFGLTTELSLLPIDRMRVVKPSAFSGVTLSEGGVTLPVAFIRSKHAARYRQDERGAILRAEPLRFREAVAIAVGEDGQTAIERVGGVTFLRATDGSLVREDQAVRVDRTTRPPAWAAAGRRWIDVSILKQTLVAYEGTTPVYATLVSTGADGLGDPKKTHSTALGTFMIHTKHVTATMDGDDGAEFDLRDVPFVQYFTEGFALHAAYWHDDFGTPRSHGCVNLSPIDAAWLFGWTTPHVPKGWHAALSLRGGTLVFTHP